MASSAGDHDVANPPDRLDAAPARRAPWSPGARGASVPRDREVVMERIRKQAFIDAAPAKVFGWIGDPRHLPEIWPSMVEVSKVEMRPNGANSFDWTYKMAGVKFHGHSDTLEVEPDRLRVVHNGSGIPSTFRWRFAPHGTGTDLELDLEYEMPGQLLGRLAAPFVRRLNEREAETLVQNLKERMETDETKH